MPRKTAQRNLLHIGGRSAQTMLSLAALLSRPCSSRYAASLSHQSWRTMITTSVLRDEKKAQPQTPATDNLELSAVSPCVTSGELT